MRGDAGAAGRPSAPEGRRRLPRGVRGGPRSWRPLPLSARRRGALPRPRFALPAPGRSRPLASRRPAALLVVGRWMEGGSAREPRRLRAARRHVLPVRNLRRRRREAAAARGPGSHRSRADAARRLPGRAQLGLRRRLPLRARALLRRPRRPAPARRRDAPPGSRRVARRRLQPLRPGRGLLGALQPALLLPGSPDSLGRRAQPRWAVERPGARLLRGERHALAGGVSLRRPASRRHPCPDRRQPAPPAGRAAGPRAADSVAPRAADRGGSPEPGVDGASRERGRLGTGRRLGRRLPPPAAPLPGGRPRGLLPRLRGIAAAAWRATTRATTATSRDRSRTSPRPCGMAGSSKASSPST